jgi:hypothetical protein
VDFQTDLIGSPFGLIGKALHFGSDDGKAASDLCGSRRLDPRVQRQQVDLTDDVADQFDDAAHLVWLAASVNRVLKAAIFIRCPAKKMRKVINTPLGEDQGLLVAPGNQVGKSNPVQHRTYLGITYRTLEMRESLGRGQRIRSS